MLVCGLLELSAMEGKVSFEDPDGQQLRLVKMYIAWEFNHSGTA